MPKKANVVIVGGGPMGLAAALSLKLLNPNINVITYEKYEEYQRKHTLVVEHDKLDGLMKVTQGDSVEGLKQLSQRIKKDANIRTNEFEGTFKRLSQEHNVNLIRAEINESNLEEKLLLPSDNGNQVNLIIGADGTHGVVNQSIFPKDNQIKYEFDFVLQLRYEIKGPNKSKKINKIDFGQTMVRHAYVANEYVGYHDGQHTPVTMQMMISKDEFESLQFATSKNPVKMFAMHEAANSLHSDEKRMPEHIKGFINNYLEQKIQNCEAGEFLDRESIRVSVNEAPATCVKQATIRWNNVPVLLLGDASLGLSYFKGLNAGLEEITKLMLLLSPIIDQLNDADVLETALLDYQQWFLNDFAPEKIKEVASYSTWQIRLGMRLAETFCDIQNTSYRSVGDESEYLLLDYLYLLGTDKEKQRYADHEWVLLYPHRETDLVRFGQISKTTVQYSFGKIKKMFADYAKPYDSTGQIIQDFKQPLVGLANVGVGVIKLVNSVVVRDKSYFADACATLLRGGLEIVTTPLAYFVKPITRDLAAHFYDPLLIEVSVGIQSLTEKGLTRFSQISLPNATNMQIYELLAFCNDIHRKFEKLRKYGQETKIEMQEAYHFREVRYSFYADPKNLVSMAPKIQRYFMLFQSKRPLQVEEKQVDMQRKQHKVL